MASGSGVPSNGNLRNWEVTPSTGTDVKNTKMLEPGAHRTAAEKSTNSMKEYTTSSGIPKDNLGAQNSHS